MTSGIAAGMHYLSQMGYVHRVHRHAVSLSLSLSLSVLTVIFPGKLGLADVIEAKDDGSVGDNWSWKVKSPLPTNQHVFYRPDALPVTQPTVSNH